MPSYDGHRQPASSLRDGTGLQGNYQEAHDGAQPGTVLSEVRPGHDSRGSERAAPAPSESREKRSSSSSGEPGYNLPRDYESLDEVEAIGSRRDPGEDVHAATPSLQSFATAQRRSRGDETSNQAADSSARLRKGPRWLNELSTVSYLIFFSIWGTLARLGLDAITFYPGAPVSFSVLWANVGGSFIMGFLIQDSKLFRHFQSRASVKDEQLSSASKDAPRDPADEAKAIAETKKLTPLYIGLATGFCGSFTSFSSFIRDAFLAMSNNLPNPDTAAIPHRNGGYSFMALLAVLIVTISSSIAALVAGGHLALLARRITPSLPPRFTMRILDRLVMLLGPGIWLGAVLLSALPPDRSTSTSSPETKTWRGRATFALVFAPLGCLTRFYLALHLNRRLASFPLGTFAANMSGTAVLGMCYDLQHVPLGGVVGCQILEGVQDGFCGCLTTVSTWVAELASLRRGHAYRYGGVSVGVALGLLVVVMGSVQWTRGFEAIQCAT